ncbi:uncharacterized protein LOC134534343 isoform X2 [Bacillus rossius redtenbacheri]|uniref:uncharacterized protein LOC134534343 isoform X2 n=1 Tax=Bacillus rossius redtenbacheri TaxID=93214 RepID=UPI002FDE8515
MAAALYLPRHATPRQSPAARLASHSAASSDMADSVFHTRTQGTPAEGLRDQYADGKAARVWEVFIGDKNSRTRHYRNFLVGLLRRNNCRTVLDVACGTGDRGGELADLDRGPGGRGRRLRRGVVPRQLLRAHARPHGRPARHPAGAAQLPAVREARRSTADRPQELRPHPRPGLHALQVHLLQQPAHDGHRHLGAVRERAPQPGDPGLHDRHLGAARQVSRRPHQRGLHQPVPAVLLPAPPGGLQGHAAGDLLPAHAPHHLRRLQAPGRDRGPGLLHPRHADPAPVLIPRACQQFTLVTVRSALLSK